MITWRRCRCWMISSGVLTALDGLGRPRNRGSRTARAAGPGGKPLLEALWARQNGYREPLQKPAAVIVV